MKVTKEMNDNILKVRLVGRLDTNTAPALDNDLKDDLEVAERLELDLRELDYISSAGLRTILVFHKKMNAKKGTLVVQHPKDEVMEVFDMTGFSSFLNIED